MIKQLTIPLAFLLTIGSQGVAAEKKFSSNHCYGLYEGIVGLLGEADKHWKKLKDPERSDYVEIAMKIQWNVEMAANYTIIYEAFCDKKLSNI